MNVTRRSINLPEFGVINKYPPKDCAITLIREKKLRLKDVKSLRFREASKLYAANNNNEKSKIKLRIKSILLYLFLKYKDLFIELMKKSVMSNEREANTRDQASACVFASKPIHNAKGRYDLDLYLYIEQNTNIINWAIT